MMDAKTKFSRFILINRWKTKKYSRQCDWTIIGIQEWWAGPNDFCIKFCFFGIDLCFWFKKNFNL